VRARGRRTTAGAWASQDIGPLPEVGNWRRRQEAVASLRVFCEAYFNHVFFWPWSLDHLEILYTAQTCIEDGGLFAYATPRGFGKTTLAFVAALWAILSGRREYVLFVTGTQRRAVEVIKNVQQVVLSPEFAALHEDFPEAFYPLRALENNARRQRGQHINGHRTHCQWGNDVIGFPVVEGARLPPSFHERGIEVSPCSGSVLAATSLDGNLRGLQRARYDGRIVRPSFFILDDPQTRRSARSPIQTRYRLDLLHGDVLGMAPPDQRPAALLTCTTIYEGDLASQILDRSQYPQWQGVVKRLVASWPERMDLWERYIELRKESLRRGGEGEEATEFYLAHRAEMDKGAVVQWDARKYPDEVTALQHAMNLYADLGEHAFRAEYQNEPSVRGDEGEASMVSAEEVQAKRNGLERGVVPEEATVLTAFVDVHKNILYWAVVAWGEHFRGWVVDYGTFPPQPRRMFLSSEAPTPLAHVFQGMGEDGAIQAGVEHIVSELIGRKWPTTGGGRRQVERVLIDAGYKPHLVYAACRKVGPPAMPSRGVGIRAGNKPITQYKRRPGWRIGHHWYIPSTVGTGDIPHACIDTNYWKTRVHEGFAMAPGDPGAITLWGDETADHELFALHIAESQYYVITHGHGRQVCEWHQRPERPDDHWFDCLVGAMAAASMSGVAFLGQEEADTSPRKRYSAEELRQRMMVVRPGG